MSDSATMCWGFVDGLGVTAHGSVPPTDTQWAEYLDFVVEHKEVVKCAVTFTLGGAPNLKQRQKMAERVGQLPIPSALVSPARHIRLVGTAISWSTKQELKAFAPSGWEEVHKWLELSQR